MISPSSPRALSLFTVTCLLGFTLACAQGERTEALNAPEPAPASAPKARSRAAKKDRVMMEREEGSGAMGSDLGGGGRAANPGAIAMPAPPATAVESPADEASESAAPTRAWFPETFLFQPEVITDEQGIATLRTPIPDRLTTWRILALAHDRTGHQAGDVVSFTSSLPLYADPVLPAKLRVGDRVDLSIPVINTTDTTRSVSVGVRAEGLDVRGGGSLRIPGFGSAVARAQMVASSPGHASVQADLIDRDQTVDSVRHTIPVVPRGQRHATVTTGTLGGPRTLELPLPDGADPASAEANLTLIPGGLGVVQALVGEVHLRPHTVDGVALMLSVAAVAPRLWAQAGISVQEGGADRDAAERFEIIRTLRLLGVQGAMRLDADWSLDTTLSITGAAALHPDDPVLARLTDRGLNALSNLQRPDGTFGGDASGSWTIQRMLVATAGAVDAAHLAATSDPELSETRSRVLTPLRLRSQGAAERYAVRVTDAYTASALLVAGLVEGEAQNRLAQVVRDALVEGEHGLEVALPDGVQTTHGTAPSPVTVAALAARALATLDNAEDQARIADLGATVLGAFRPGPGFGSPRSDLICLQAVSDLWSSPPSQDAVLTVSLGDRPQLTRSLSVEDLRNPVFATLPVQGAGEWTLEVSPPVAGLAYAFEVVAWTPWTDPPTDPGLLLEVRPPKGLTVGNTEPMVLEVACPRNARLDIELELPAGIKVDPSDIRIDGAASIETVQSRDGFLHLQPMNVGRDRLTLHIPVQATLAGTIWSGSVSVTDRSGAQTVLPPTAWSIAR